MLTIDTTHLTSADVARIFGVSRQAVNAWILDGRFPSATKASGQTSTYLIPRVEVEAVALARIAELEAEAAHIRRHLAAP